MRILKFNRLADISAELEDIRVDPYGIGIMAPKAIFFQVKLNSISNITANILKQEMLSIGGDAAIARGSLTGQTRKTDCLLIGNLAQLRRLAQKLNRQPFGLEKISVELSAAIVNYQREDFVLSAGKHRILLGKKALVMGVLNVTPDSFSGDGCYYPKNRGHKSPACPAGRQVTSHKFYAEEALRLAMKMCDEGAGIIDVGGESSRPGAKKISAKEEISRIAPVIKAINAKLKIPISADTYKTETAKAALDNGAVIINDISGLRDKGMAKLITRNKAGVVIMHMRGVPATMQNNLKYESLIDEIIDSLSESVNKALDAGVSEKSIVIDPGIGFGKTCRQNLVILNRLSELKVLGLPVMVGASRKSFIGNILNSKTPQRLYGTIASSVLAAANGAKIIRAHDVKEVNEALCVAGEIYNS